MGKEFPTKKGLIGKVKYLMSPPE